MYLSVLFLSVVFISNAQQTYRGKIVSPNTDLEGIYIDNLTSKTSSISIAGGYFSIVAQAKDSIRFSAVHLKDFIYVVAPSDSSQKLILIPMDSAVQKLSEVLVVNNPVPSIPKFDLKDLQKQELSKITQNLVNPLATSNTGMISLATIGYLLNKLIKPKTKEENFNRVETYEKNLSLLQSHYNNDYYTQTLSIPKEKVNAFIYFILEDSRIIQALKENQKYQLDFVLIELAQKFLKE